MVAKFFGKFKTAKKPKDPKNVAAPSKTKPIKSKMKPSPNPKSESLATPTGTPRSTRATPNPAGCATNGKPGKPKPKITLPIIISIILGVIILLMVIAAVLYFVLKPSEEPANVCETPKCVSLAHQLLNWRDEKVDPCENFHQYSCGKYAEQVNSKSSPMMWKTQLMDGTIAEHLNRIKKPKKKSEKVMKKMLGLCGKAGSSWRPESLSWSPKSLEDLLDRIKEVGKFPILDSDFNDDEFNANQYMTKMGEVFGTYNFGLFQIWINQGKLLIIPETFQGLDPPIRTLEKLLSHKNMSTQPLGTYRDQMENYINNDLPTDVVDEKVWSPSVNDLHQRFRNVDFKSILDSLMSPKQLKHFEGKLYVLESMITSSNGNRDNLVAAQDKKKLANFLLLNILINANRLIIAESSCASKVIEQSPHLSLGIMIRHYFDKKNLEKASDLVDEMRDAFKKMLEESTWLQESTKKNAMKKLDKMRKVIGYNEEFDDPEKIETIFEKAFAWNENDSYFMLCLKLDTFTSRMVLEELANGRAYATVKGVVKVNAFYAQTLNLMMLNVPIMDDPLFDASFPKYAQIGSMGYVVGHEIGHAFDPEGAMLDENGNPRNWWTRKDQVEYMRRAQCVIDKYENYDDPTFGRNQLNGTLTVGENVADILGSRVSWDIYKNVDVAKEQKIAGFHDYSIDKLFFQILATRWCSPHNTLTLDNQLKDVHGVDNYRVNGVFSNMKQFAETFNCPVGSKMNPATKCDLF